MWATVKKSYFLPSQSEKLKDLSFGKNWFVVNASFVNVCYLHYCHSQAKYQGIPHFYKYCLMVDIFCEELKLRLILFRLAFSIYSCLITWNSSSYNMVSHLIAISPDNKSLKISRNLFIFRVTSLQDIFFML